MDSEDFKHLLALSGIGAKKAEALYNAGFRSIEDLRNASLEELMRVPGIGEKLARRIKEAFEEKSGEEELKLYLCPNCGAFVSEEDRVCPKCGAILEEEEEIEKTPEMLEIEENLVEKEKADGYWYKKDEHKLVICPECGAFIPEDAEVCPKCGTIFEGEEEIEGIKEAEEGVEGPIEADGHWYKEASPTIYLCPNCGAFVSEDDKVCPKCGTPLNGEEELEKEPETAEIEENLVEKEKADGYWYKKDEHKLVICPECGAFIPEDAEVCPKCGTIFEGEEEIEGTEKMGEAREADGFWYKEDGRNLMMCPECGAFIPEDAEVCPKCGAVFTEEEHPKEERLPEIPVDKILEISPGERAEKEEEKILDIEELLGEYVGKEREEAEEEEETEEELEERKKRRSLELGEELGNIFETPAEKSGVSKEFASRWETLFSNKPYGPESAYEHEEKEESEEEEKVEERKGKTLSGEVYRKRGLTNGLTNGRAYKNGEIRISKTNGRTNGFRRNGRTNGLTNGFINGSIISANGLINGGEKLLESIEEERPLRRGIVSITILLAILIITPLLMSFLITPVPKEIGVGNGFGDWQDIVEYPDSISDQPYDQNINFEALKVYEDWGGISFYARIVQGGRLFETGNNGVSSIVIFIDSDSRTSTGYYVKGIGADYMIEIDGWNGTAHSHSLYSWNSSRSQDDWNGWIREKEVAVSNNGREIETKVAIEGMRNPKIIFASRDYFGNEDFSDVIISTQKGALRVDEFSIGPAIAHRNEETQMLRLNLRAYGSGVSLEAMRFRGIENSSIGLIRLYRDNGNGIFDGGDVLLGSAGQDATIHLSEEIGVGTENNITLIATVTPSSSALSGESVNIYLDSVSISQGSVTIVPHLTGGSYIDRIPSSPVIDGTFHDWDNILKNSDAAGDVIPSDNPNIDISQYAVWPHNGLSFYVSVDGNMLGGEDLPFTKHRPRPILDHDHDGIPDSQDRFPYDFDNDGIPDSEDTDRDDDGIPDNPGPDRWLNNTQTGAHIYIGPVHIPVKTGYDYAMLFVDMDGNTSTGYRAPWLPIGADYLIQVEGRDMRINGSVIMRFTGEEQRVWNWSIEGRADAAIAYKEMECYAPLNASGNSRFFIYTTDWENNRDYGNGVLRATRALSGNTVDATTVTKTLYLHQGDVLNTTVGASTSTIRIRDGTSHSWTQSPPFAMDFHVESATVSLYISAVDNRPVNPTVYVYLMDGNTVVGSANRVVSSTGWINLDLGAVGHVFETGNTTTLLVSVPNTRGRTSITISYDSQNYDSRIDMNTDTYVNVDDISTYNDTANTDTFHQGDMVHIEAYVSDPFGSYDISGATIRITDPNGTVVVDDEPMNPLSSNESSVLFAYNYSVPYNSSRGEYTIEVTGIESNGVSSSKDSYFIVPPNRGVTIGPDSTSEVSPDSYATYNLTIKNIGELDDTYEIRSGNSTQYWRTELWVGSSEIAYDSNGDGSWDWINSSYNEDEDDFPEFYLSSGDSLNITVKKYVPPSTYGSSDETYIYAVSESEGNISDFAAMTTDVPSQSISKTLHLHLGNSMDTLTGSSDSAITISNGESNAWIQSPPFSKDFNITSYVTIHLYLDPTPATGWFNQGNPDVTVELSYNGSSIGSDTITDIGSAGWYEFTVPVSDTRTIPAGDSIRLDVSVSSAGAGWFGRPGYVDLYYDSQSYDSRIVMPTDTYVSVDSIETYNSSAKTDVFYQGENVHIVSNISDPFGYWDISGANITIIDPTGAVVVHDVQMTEDSHNGSTKTFYYDFQTDNESDAGEYTIYVTGIESNGVTDTKEGRFLIPAEYGVSVYPDQSKEGEPNTVVNFVFTIRNIGNVNDTYELSLSASEHGWKTEIWYNGTEIAYDNDGDGDIDWVNPSYDKDGDGIPEISLDSLEMMNITVKRYVPADAGSVTNTVLLMAKSEANESVEDGAKATIYCPYPYNTKTLHLHSDDSMDTFSGSSTNSLRINNSESHTWTQNPPFAMDFNISSYITVYLYLSPTPATGWFNQGNPDVTVEISYNGTVIGDETLSDIAGEGWYVFSIDVSSGLRIPAGDSISLSVSVSSAAGGLFGRDGYVTIYYDSSSYDSRLELPTDTVVKVEDIKTYKGNMETNIFSSGDTVTIRSNVSDPLGSQDIAGADIRIISPNGTVLVQDSMSLESSDSAHNTYIYNYSLPDDAFSGEYQVEITGIESNGVINIMDGNFIIPCGVTVEPNHTVNASSPSVVYFNHTITNTGMGANIFEITLISQNGYNVSIYASDGTLMGYDSNGDGVWDYVNPDYDIDRDGVPDTGILLPGDSFDFTVAVNIPSNETGWENVTVNVESIFGMCNDSATDTIYVPEFQNLFLPLAMGAILPIVIRKRRKRIKR